MPYQHHLIVGVTGHRDLPPDAIPELENQVGKILDDVERRFPGLPKALLSPLAEGSDRLVARKAMARGYRLRVPLPMPQTEYEKDFGGKSLAEFRELIEKAESVFVVPVLSFEQQSPDYGRQDVRDTFYTETGKFVSVNSQVLLCLYDGNMLQLRGGSSHVAAIKREGAEPCTGLKGLSLAQWQLPDYGLMYNLVTPRLNSALKPKGVLFSWEVNGTNVERDVEKATAKIQRMHCRLAQYEKKSVGGACAATGQAENQRKASTAMYNVFYEQADRMAIAFQRRTYRFLNAIFCTALFAAVFAGAYSELSPLTNFRVAEGVEGNPLLLLGYIALFAFAFGIYLVCKSRDIQSWYQDVRALAEGLRVQKYWAGMNISHLAADCYLAKQRSQLDWIRLALRNYHMDVLGQTASACTICTTSTLAGIKREWVMAQEDYYCGKTVQQELQMKRNEDAAKYLFFGGILSALVLICLSAWCWLSPECNMVKQLLCLGGREILGFFICVLPVFAGLIKFRIDRLGWKEHVLLYRQMALIFENARLRLDDLLSNSSPEASADSKMNAARQILLDLGTAALTENADWLVLHRFKVVEMPN